MSRRSFLLFAAALLLPPSALAIPGPASAIADPVSRVVLHDPAGDVWAIGDGPNDKWVSAGAVPTADVVRAVVHHRRHRVQVRMTFTNLRRVEPQHYSAMIFGPRRTRLVFVSAEPGRWTGRHELVNGSFDSVKCPQLSHRINYDTEQVTVSVPRRCIGRPPWVKATMQNFMFRETKGDFQEINDNPHSDGPEGSFTRRLYRAVS